MNSFGRIASYVSLAKDVVVHRMARSDESKDRTKALIADRLGRMKGIPQKFGQMLSYSWNEEDAGPNSFQILQDSSRALSWTEIEPILKSEWTDENLRAFQFISPHAYAASLGQVHQGILCNGRKVAIKIQYPGIASSIRTDTRLIGLIGSAVPQSRSRFDIKAYQTVLAEGLEKELDYRLEQTSQRLFGDRWKNDERIVIPQVYSDLSTSHVLVSSWEDGETWAHVQSTWPQDAKRKLASILLTFFWESLFHHGTLHADQHPGNFRFRRSGERVSIVVYDFGSVLELSDTERLALLRLMRASSLEPENPLPLMQMLGFDGELLAPIEDKLSEVIQVLFEPFVTGTYEPANWNLSRRIQLILGESRWNLRTAGPPRMLYLIRAFHGLMYYIQGLGAPFECGTRYMASMHRFHQAMQGLVLPGADKSDSSIRSRSLCVRMSENGECKVHLSLPAKQLDNLRELIDPVLWDRIRRGGVDLDAMIKEHQNSNYAPGSLFQWTENGKSVQVWLE